MKNFTLKTLLGILFLWIPFMMNAQLIYAEDFETTAMGTLPAGFAVSTLATDNGWKVGTKTEASSVYWGPDASNTTKYAYTNDDACDCDKSNDKLILPSQDFTVSPDGVVLEANIFMDGEWQGKGYVEVSTDAGATWTTILNIPNNAAFQAIMLDMNPYKGMADVLLAFRYDDSGFWSDGMVVDDIFISVGGVLPVEFISFTGKADGRSNKLDWATASEMNNSHFEIERSADGMEFERIGIEYGIGNSTELVEYYFMDENPLSKAYYRLKQVDFDGQYDYSEIIVITRPIDNPLEGTVKPNPTRGLSMLEFSVVNDGEVDITIINIGGRTMSAQRYAAALGLNQVELDLTSYANGVYFISIHSNGERTLTRLIKS